jgi:hypothetical protein
MRFPQNQSVYNINVQQLMLSNVKSWNINKIKSLSSEAEAHDILVPLIDIV